ncbi:translation initiation factor IF-2 [Eubalaena glacialis]|uniref:translation initiation factor IF-2 n=1 Tax=Eubalaena glacialis TaxID=27606 RepID=UPI002A59D911|nr:translation initiation factor IF-2 [Eubalaena glacialis]
MVTTAEFSLCFEQLLFSSHIQTIQDAEQPSVCELRAKICLSGPLPRVPAVHASSQQVAAERQEWSTEEPSSEPSRANPPSPRSEARSPTDRPLVSEGCWVLPLSQVQAEPPWSYGQPFRQPRGHGQAQRQGWPAEAGGGGCPSGGEEVEAGAGRRKCSEGGRRRRATTGQGRDRHPDRC